LMVAHDDIDLPFGTIRIRPGGGAAGQRGMASIIQQVGTQDFARMRLGVGRPPGQMDRASYVLERFHKSELPVLDQMLDRSEAAVREFIRSGLDAAMNQYNGSLLDRKDNA
jgi:peptidyl-tRNA hydrolase, PTH1 family